MPVNDWISVFDWKGIEKWIPKAVLGNLHKLTGADRIEIKLHERVKTVADVVRILDVPSEAILKALFIRFSHDKLALVCTSGFNRVDLKKVSILLGDKKAELLPFKLIPNYTSIPVGAISPLTYQTPPVLLDLELSNSDILYMGTGNNCASFKVPLNILKQLSFVTWGDIAKAEP